MFPYALARSNPVFYYAYTSVQGRIGAKKRAKVQLFFDMTKYFLKKNQKKCILHGLFGILTD